MEKNPILNVPVDNITVEDILEKIKKFTAERSEFAHIVSINPEIVVLANERESFMKVVRSAQIRIIDGFGIVLASQILYGTRTNKVNRVTGVDLMSKLIDLAARMRLTVGLIGGKGNIAERLADCYNERFPEAKFFGLAGFQDIQKPEKNETNNLFSIVADRRPHIIFFAFGSPQQEEWIWNNRSSLQGIVCMGVGGAFDFLSGDILRAPSLIRRIGLEWFFRLILQPWRLKRQIRLFKFMFLVLKERFFEAKK